MSNTVKISLYLREKNGAIRSLQLSISYHLVVFCSVPLASLCTLPVPAGYYFKSSSGG